ncbi:hypothetical protein [Pantanalinema sp. GBBB05]|uniref:hypothetical protein n=1 Tax=Pantanalinema sp. GBBB05 TaxID=2604139 RepID=UPI001DEA941F|nr:translation initiation factor [Pantanalinema sp. GBBB05]
MVDGFFRKIQEALTDDQGNYFEPDDRRVRPASEDPYGDPADQSGDGLDGFGHVRSADQDPYGDPADQYGGGFGNIRPASQDPYGDPADQYGDGFDGFGNVRSVSEDPYGDPADEDPRYFR